MVVGEYGRTGIGMSMVYYGFVQKFVYNGHLGEKLLGIKGIQNCLAGIFSV
jgi:hypothetical protein